MSEAGQVDFAPVFCSPGGLDAYIPQEIDPPLPFGVSRIATGPGPSAEAAGFLEESRSIRPKPRLVPIQFVKHLRSDRRGVRRQTLRGCAHRKCFRTKKKY